MRCNTLRLTVVALVASAAALSATAQGTRQSDAAQGNTGDTARIEEIIVTATRIEQNLQQVPMSIDALRGEDLDQRGLESLERVSQAVPNLLITGSGPGTLQPNFRIRGIPNVGTYVDGVWQVNTAGMLNGELVDIDRIEVLRGPQGTTFGRDSTGGAIRIWTKKPSSEYSVDMNATVGTYSRRDVDVAVNLPLADKLRTKWTAASLNRDGYVKSLTTGKSSGGIDQTMFSGDVVWSPSDRLEWRIKYQQGKSFFAEPRLNDGVFKGTYAQAGQAVGSMDLYEAAGQEAFTAETQTAGYPGGAVGEWQSRSEVTLPSHVFRSQASSDLTWDVGGALKVELLVARTAQESVAITDWDNSQYQLIEDVGQAKLGVSSQELQVSGKKGRLTWLGGAYFWGSTNRIRGTRYALEEFISGRYDINAAFASPICTAVEHPRSAPPNTYPFDCEDIYFGYTGPGNRSDLLGETAEHGRAAFGQVTMTLGPSIDLTLGLRHHDQDSLTQALIAIPGVTAPRAASANVAFVGDVFAGTPTAPAPSHWTKNTKRLTLQKQFTDDVMGYVGYSEGFDSGGSTLWSDPTTGGYTVTPYGPETVRNTEVGVRSDLAGKKLRLNATLFHTVWQDIQSKTLATDSTGHLVGNRTVTTNVGEATADGGELELSIVPTRSLRFDVDIGKLRTKYTRLAPGTLFLTLDSAFEDAPSTTGSVGIEYDAMLHTGASLTTRVDYLYQSQFWRSLPFLRTSYWRAVPAGFDESGGAGITNARVTYRPSKGDWDVAVFGTNLSNVRLIDSGFFSGAWAFDFATVGRPREAGLELRVRF